MCAANNYTQLDTIKGQCVCTFMCTWYVRQARYVRSFDSVNLQCRARDIITRPAFILRRALRRLFRYPFGNFRPRGNNYAGLRYYPGLDDGGAIFPVFNPAEDKTDCTPPRARVLSGMRPKHGFPPRERPESRFDLLRARLHVYRL